MEEESHNEKHERLKRELAALPPQSQPWQTKLQELKALNASYSAQSEHQSKRQRTAGRRRRNRRKTRRSRK
jgi:hypothetical protein